MKNAYFLVTDLHLAIKKDSRKNYFNEVLGAMSSIIELESKYKERGYNCVLLLLGDSIDRSVTNTDNAIMLSNVLRYFCGTFARCYSVIGNHEISYATSNPFWHMVTDIEDTSLNKLCRYIQPKGVEQLITVPAELEDGNVSFYFNHYGTTPKVPKRTAGKIAIGLFHQDVGSNDICKMWGTFENVEEAAFVQTYDYVFFGHLHKAFGKFWLNESHTCHAEWLGSIGRANATEVFDTSLERNVPVVLVEDGEFVSIEDNEILLPPAEECVDIPKYESAKQVRKDLEERKEKAAQSVRGVTLYDSVKASCLNAGLSRILDICDSGPGTVLLKYARALESEPEIVEAKSEEADTGSAGVESEEEEECLQIS